jgi:hypothetical protein
MSSLIACKNRKGIVLAADSKAVDVDTMGGIQEMSVRRLLQLTDHTALLAGGAAAGQQMADRLKRFISDEKLTDVESVYHAALPFLASEYEQFMRKNCEIMPLDPIHHVHFILGGQTENDSQNPFRLYFLWTKRQLPQLDGDEIRWAFSVPRFIRVEYRLAQLCVENAGLNRVLAEVRAGMQRQAETLEEVAGPFAYAIIDREGFKKVAE